MGQEEGHKLEDLVEDLVEVMLVTKVEIQVEQVAKVLEVEMVLAVMAVAVAVALVLLEIIQVLLLEMAAQEFAQLSQALEYFMLAAAALCKALVVVEVAVMEVQ